MENLIFCTVMFRRQRNYFSSLIRKQKKQFYADLDINDVTNKKFWKTIKQLFRDKTKSSNAMILVEKDNMVTTDNYEIAKILNSYFTNGTKYSRVHKVKFAEDSLFKNFTWSTL